MSVRLEGINLFNGTAATRTLRHVTEENDWLLHDNSVQDDVGGAGELIGRQNV